MSTLVRMALSCFARATACGVLLVVSQHGRAADPLLPDLVSVASIADRFMYDGEFDTTSEPGRVLYRFDVAITNLGEGPFEVFEVTDLQLQIQDVYQHIFDTEGAFTSQLMDTFDYEQPPFGHLHLEALARYNLREVTAGEGVGAVVATKDKTSHAVVDSVAIDTSLPAAPTSRVYTSAFDNPLGISVGYADLYGRNIPQQRIDVTGVPSGQYWLEVIVDPMGYVQETDDTNNTTRILVDLTIPTLGDIDEDGDVDGYDFLEWQRGFGGTYDGNYLADWEANYGTVAPLSAVSAAVPEPNSLALLCLGGLLAIGRFHRATAFTA
jgi:hypothetical protein